MGVWVFSGLGDARAAYGSVRRTHQTGRCELTPTHQRPTQAHAGKEEVTALLWQDRLPWYAWFMPATQLERVTHAHMQRQVQRHRGHGVNKTVGCQRLGRCGTSIPSEMQQRLLRGSMLKNVHGTDAMQRSTSQCCIAAMWESALYRPPSQ